MDMVGVKMKTSTILSFRAKRRRVVEDLSEKSEKR